jgi:carbon storage regulator
MLILSRKASEGIMIGDDIEIRVARIDHDSVRIGIRAPRHLSIYRDEIYHQARESNLAAARRDGDAIPPALPLRPTPQEPTAPRP